MEVVFGDDEVTGRYQMDSIEERKGIMTETILIITENCKGAR